jgi:hypothetical protein
MTFQTKIIRNSDPILISEDDDRTEEEDETSGCEGSASSCADLASVSERE